MTPDLDAVLFDLHLAHPGRHPTHAEMTAWCRRFPAHRQAIAEHVAAWTLLDLLPPGGRGDRSFDGA